MRSSNNTCGSLKHRSETTLWSAVAENGRWQRRDMNRRRRYREVEKMMAELITIITMMIDEVDEEEDDSFSASLVSSSCRFAEVAPSTMVSNGGGAYSRGIAILREKERHLEREKELAERESCINVCAGDCVTGCIGIWRERERGRRFSLDREKLMLGCCGYLRNRRPCRKFLNGDFILHDLRIL